MSVGSAAYREKLQKLWREHEAAHLYLDPDHHGRLSFSATLRKTTSDTRIRRHRRSSTPCGSLSSGSSPESAPLVGTQHDRQLAWLSRLDDALRDRAVAERRAVEKPQRTDDLVEGGP